MKGWNEYLNILNNTWQSISGIQTVLLLQLSMNKIDHMILDLEIYDIAIVKMNIKLEKCSS